MSLEEELNDRWLNESRREIAIGNAEAGERRGEFVHGEEVFAEIRKRSAERKRSDSKL